MGWVWGPGVPDGCTVLYWSSLGTPTSTQLAWCVMKGPGSTSDRKLSVGVPVRGCPFLGSTAEVGFNDSFSDAPCPAGSTVYCAPTRYTDAAVGTWIQYRQNIIGFPVEIPLPGAQPAPSISAFSPVNQSVSYLLTGGGFWSFQWSGVTPPAEGGLMVWGPHGAVTSSPEGSSCSFS